MKRTILAFFLFALLALTGCVDKNRTPESIYLESNAFPSAYTVDESIHLENVSLILVYPNGDRADIPCTENMIEGFDTSTTGQKTFRAVYGGLRSNNIAYSVYNPEDMSREIATKTRIVFIKTVTSGGGTNFDFYLSSADISVRAITFRMETTLPELSAELSELSASADGTMDSYYWKKTAVSGINVLISSSEHPQATGAFFHLMIQSADVDITLCDIIVSDGSRDYYLPKAV